MDKKNLLKRLLIIPILIVFFFIRNTSDDPSTLPVSLTMIAVVFLSVFGAILWQGIQQWRKSDEEILSEFSPMVNMLGIRGVDSAKGFRTLGGAFLITAIFLYRAWGRPAFIGACIFCSVAISIVAIPTLYTWYTEKKAASSSPPKKPQVTGEQIAALLIGLVTCGFMCFFCGLGIYHGVWWFVLPPGLIFLCMFSRPLVAAIRTMLRSRESREQEPWDRSDIGR